jgi:hypothetical protein
VEKESTKSTTNTTIIIDRDRDHLDWNRAFAATKEGADSEAQAHGETKEVA